MLAHCISRAEIVITLSDISGVITIKKKENDSVTLNRGKNVRDGKALDSLEQWKGHNYICHSNPINKNNFCHVKSDHLYLYLVIFTMQICVKEIFLAPLQL